MKGFPLESHRLNSRIIGHGRNRAKAEFAALNHFKAANSMDRLLPTLLTECCQQGARISAALRQPMSKEISDVGKA
jgi:hypothetical protein